MVESFFFKRRAGEFLTDVYYEARELVKRGAKTITEKKHNDQNRKQTKTTRGKKKTTEFFLVSFITAAFIAAKRG
jgi:hypothetical protein